MKKIAVFTLMLMLQAQGLWAQWSNDPAVNNAICTLEGEQAIPKIATCPNGDSYIGFFSNEGGNYNIRLQRLDSQGNEMWTSNGILISSNASDTWLTDWDMAADVENHCIMTWQDIRNGNNNAYAYRISPSGERVWGNNGIALSDNSEFNASPKVVTTKAGNSVFAWMSGDVIILQKISPDGQKLWGIDGISLSSFNRLTWPQMIPVGVDDIILKYYDDSGPVNAPTRHLLARRFNSDGAPVWISPTIVSNAGGISAWTQILPFINDGTDGFYIAWHDDRDNNTLASSWVQHINSAGIAQYAANGVEVTTSSGFHHFYPNLAIPTGSSELYVFWNEMNNLQTLRGIYGQKISANGSRLWGESGKVFIPVSSTNYYPIAAGSTDSDVILMYEAGLSGMNGQLKAMRIANDGSYVWPGNHVLVSSVASAKVHTVMNEFHNNQWIISWEDDRSGTSDIYAQNLLPDGTLGIWTPATGFVHGRVVMGEEIYDVTEVSVTAGDLTVHPDAEGNYILELTAGTWSVTASHPYTTSQTIGNILIEPGITLYGVDFLLEPLRTDLICKTIDQYGSPLPSTEITINGPGGSYSGIITGDSLIFGNMPYGHYSGSATHPNAGTISGDTIINADNQHFIFIFIIGKSPGESVLFQLNILPNPVTMDSRLILQTIKRDSYNFSLYHPGGQLIYSFKTGTLDEGSYEWTVGSISGGKLLLPGNYVLVISSGNAQKTLKLMVK